MSEDEQIQHELDRMELDIVSVDGLRSAISKWKSEHVMATDVMTEKLSLEEAKAPIQEMLRQCFHRENEVAEDAALIAGWFLLKADKVQMAALWAFLEDED